MRGKNAYLTKQEAVKQAFAQVGERVGQQLMSDCMMLTLNEEFGFGYDRIKRAFVSVMKKYNQYHDALDGGPEADYVQERLDAAIRRIMKDRERFCPFEERYPDIKKTTYGKKGKV